MWGLAFSSAQSCSRFLNPRNIVKQAHVRTQRVSGLSLHKAAFELPQHWLLFCVWVCLCEVIAACMCTKCAPARMCVWYSNCVCGSKQHPWCVFVHFSPLFQASGRTSYSTVAAIIYILVAAHRQQRTEYLYWTGEPFSLVALKAWFSGWNHVSCLLLRSIIIQLFITTSTAHLCSFGSYVLI